MILAQNRRQPLNGSSLFVNLIIAAMVLCAGYNTMHAQEEKPIPVSQVVELVDGKKYYIHEVRTGQTVYRIAKAYNLTPQEVFTYNPDAREGIRPGQMLMLPVALVERNMRLQREGPPKEEPQPPHETEEKEQKKPVHKVQKGETLYSLARTYQVSTEEIKALNPGMVDILREGQMVILPAGVQTEENDTIKYYTVKPGETLYRIALNHDLSVEQIIRLNPELAEKGLKAGATIKLPKITHRKKDKAPPEKDEDYLIHKVEAGETLYSLSMQYAISISMLKEINPFLADGLKEGQEIRIPVDPHRKEPYPSVLLPHQQVKDSIMFVKQTDTTLVHCDSVKIKPSYRIALYMPLHLDHAPNIRLRDVKKGQWIHKQFKAFENLPFYHGFKLALDSLERMGMNAQVYVYDTKGSPQTMSRLLQEDDLASYDLIFGPFDDNLLEMLVKEAKKTNTKVVAPLSYSQRLITDNQHVIKAIAPINYQIDALMNYVAQNYEHANIILVYSSREGQDELCQRIAQSLATKLNINPEVPPWKMVEYDSQGFYKVEELLDSDRQNLIFAMHRGEARINRLMSHLHSIREDYPIHILGSSEWEHYESIENSYYSNLGYTSFSDYMVDLDDLRTQTFVKAFVEKYNTWPDEMAFRGFDLGYFFLNALYNYGLNFPHCMNHSATFTMHQPFLFVQNGTDAWINTKINIFQHQNLKRKNMVRDFETDNQTNQNDNNHNNDNNDHNQD